MSSEATDRFEPSDLYVAARQYYEALGFDGWLRFVDLPTADLPAASGVYVVLRPGRGAAAFVATSRAGWHKGRNPTVDPVRLSAKWVPATAVLYLGKAANLDERLNAYRRQGSGSKAGHWGGRFIWQCADADELRVGWMPTTDDPGGVEFDLIAQFRAQHQGRLPFANLNQGRRRTPP